ncbi:MAG: DUF397 domain-containing protein [Sciscionella sp.]
MTGDQWRKSSHSHPNTNCVELRHTLDAVRDSKNGAVLPLNATAISNLLAAVKRGR